MQLEVKNVGKFYNNTSIEINGITILAGENGTGKSTLGKTLYCIFNSLYDYKTQVVEERERSILRLVRIVSQKPRQLTNFRKKIRELIESKESEYTDEFIRSAISDIIGIQAEKMDDSIVEKIKNILTATESSILDAMIARHIKDEFDSQIGHICHQGEPSIIKLTIKDKPIIISVDINGKITLSDKFNLVKDLVYIDDPYVLDDLSYFNLRGEKTHKEDIISKLISKKESQYSAVDDVLVDDKLKTIYEILDNICEGDISQKEDDNYYSESKLGEGISLKNLSTGMKGFVILKSLLKKGYLEEKGIVILDEPEAHLHPEWMLKYAEIVTLLQKILDINFIVSTHSSEFLSYIELYTKEYEIEEKCKYYLLENDPDDVMISSIRDCTQEIDVIYKKLARPFLWASRKLDEEV